MRAGLAASGPSGAAFELFSASKSTASELQPTGARQSGNRTAHTYQFLCGRYFLAPRLSLN